jgi:uncharacterized caspase-like protein
MRALGVLVLAVWSVCLFGQPALAEKRVALVIGNSDYQKVARLGNPANDAAAMTATLRSAGFDVVDSRRDLKTSEMRRALRDFSDQARDADVAVVYYAGHGIELEGTNYLLPIDAVLERDIDIYDEAISLDRILVTIEPARQLRLVILDAFRDNPFSRTMKRTIGSRAIGRGLAKIEPTSPNTLIAFAAKAGSTASDGNSKNSPFTAALVRHIAKPGLDLRKAFGFVRDDVLKATNNTQEPFVYGSLGGNDVALVPAAPAPAAPVDQDATMRRDYDYAERISTKPVWDAFIDRYPSGFFTALAKAQRDKVAAEAARIEATNKAKAAQEQQTRLAAEGAKAAAQAKAAEQARLAEQARVAAELAKKAEEAKVAEAERARTSALAKAAEDAKAAEADKAAAEAKIAAEQKTKDDKAAALTPPAEKSDQQATVDLPRSLQSELRRVGCNTGSVDGNWNATSQRSLDLFNKYAGMKLDVKVASIDALDAVKAKSGRICPLVCEPGYKADGDRCVKITCSAGLFVNKDNECEKKRDREKPTARRQRTQTTPKKREQGPTGSEFTRPQATGQIFCGSTGCRPVRPGCRLATGWKAVGKSQSFEVCN